MKSYKIWLVIVLALLAVNSGVLAVMWLQHKRPLVAREHGDARQGMEPKDVLINALALTAKQQEIYDGMRKSHMDITRKLNEEGHALHDSLFSNIKKNKIDSAVINSITKKISDNQVQMEKATLYHFRSFRAILTPEQERKFDGIINDVLRMMSRPGPMQGQPERGGPGNDMRPDSSKRGQTGRPHDKGRRGDHFGLPPDGMPPPDGDRRHHGPPPGGRPPGPDGMPPDGPPPNGGPPNGPPPDGRPPL